VHSSLNVGIHVLRWPLDRRNYVADAGEMKHVVRVPKQASIGLDVPNIALLEGEVWILRVLRQVGGSTAAQIVDDPHAIALVEQHIDHVTSNKTGATGNDRNLTRCAHFAPIVFIVRTL
jgi:hypothetical protein